jgi:hypothetical protein
MLTILRFALSGMVVLFFSAPVSAGPCGDHQIVTLDGKVAKLKPTSILRTFFIDDPSLDCSPIIVLEDAHKSRKCSVGDHVSVEGHLQQDAVGNWVLGSDDWTFKCSKH